MDSDLQKVTDVLRKFSTITYHWQRSLRLLGVDLPPHLPLRKEIHEAERIVKARSQMKKKRTRAS